MSIYYNFEDYYDENYAEQDRQDPLTEQDLYIEEHLAECDREYQAEMDKQINLNELEQEEYESQVPEPPLK